MKKQRVIINVPAYLFINFSLMKAFKLEEPLTKHISFPFAQSHIGSLNSFRKAFQML